MAKIKIFNNGIIYVVISLLLVAGVAGAYSLSQNINVTGDYNYYESEGQPENINFGAFPGGDIYSDINIFGNLTHGGGQYYTTTTRDATHTFTFNDLNKYTYWDIMNREAADSHLTFTLPATSTMLQILPEVGSSRTWYFHNATTTENTLTFAAGAGMDVVGIDNSAEVLAAGDWARMDCVQIAYRDENNENIMCMFDLMIDAD